MRDGVLCGVIFATYENEPYAHMITAESLFMSIPGFEKIPKSPLNVVNSKPDDIPQDQILVTAPETLPLVSLNCPSKNPWDRKTILSLGEQL